MTTPTEPQMIDAISGVLGGWVCGVKCIDGVCAQANGDVIGVVVVTVPADEMRKMLTRDPEESQHEHEHRK